MKSLTAILESLGEERRPFFDLSAFQAALEESGHPERTSKTIVIGGTNGKGTTTLLVSAALREAAFNVATYLSPHLEEIHERFLMNLAPVPSSTLDRIALEALPYARRHKLSYFEFLTLIQFFLSREYRPDYLVLEVGLGGRLDATNVTTPIATAVTNIDWDHAEILGDTLEKIRAEKMGITRTGVPHFSGIEGPELSIERIETTLDGQKCLISAIPFTLKNPTIGAARNAELAFRLIREVFPMISVETIQRAFANVSTPGRFEIVQHSPNIVLSGDHNPAGIQCLIDTLTELRIENPYILCGFSPDKPKQQMLEMLGSISTRISVTEIARFHGSSLAPSAFDEVKRKLTTQDTLIVTGSLYLVGELRTHVKTASTSR